MKNNIETAKGSCEKASNGGNRKKVQVSLSCENENKSQSQGGACWGKIATILQMAVSIITGVNVEEIEMYVYF